MLKEWLQVKNVCIPCTSIDMVVKKPYYSGITIRVAHYYLLIKCVSKSIGSGKIIVEFFSAEMSFRVWR